MKALLAILITLLRVSQPVAPAADDLVIYPPDPGLAASEHYTVRNRAAKDGGEWRSAFAWETACKVKDGKVFVTLDQPCLVAVDLDGRMDDQDTGKGCKGPPIHTLSLFANPLLEGRPEPGDPGVFTVKPGEITLDGKPVTGAEFFKVNDSVDSLHFKPATEP